MKTLFRSRMRFVLIPILAVAFVFLVGFLVMQLWNHTLPSLFGTSAITLWQAIMLFFLCKLLFGFGGGGPGKGGPPWRKKAMARKFDQMGEEDRARVRAYMRSKSNCWGDVADRPEEKTEGGETQ
ncbi:hypothetical protein [Parapedobacter sp. 10938]|uniref:hypothetical protein n=1 Tax=Parapedobacter flavus TaxID=3110225 RepID=UPI002DBEA484|nr:hypothetical protein [Parapedobacter sp. 10938]MEC3880902.1 hypothetical protein [Parapedobacter sp. 10938]